MKTLALLLLVLTGCLSQDVVELANTPARLELAAVDAHRGTFDACAAVVDEPLLLEVDRKTLVAVAAHCSARVRAAWEPLLVEFERAADNVCRVFRGANGCATAAAAAPEKPSAPAAP